MEPFIGLTGTPGTTFRMASTDVAQYLTPANLINSAGKRATGVLITVETNSIRFGFNATITEGASGLGHLLTAGSSYKISSPKGAQQFKFLSAAAGVHGAIIATAEFED